MAQVGGAQRAAPQLAAVHRATCLRSLCPPLPGYLVLIIPAVSPAGNCVHHSPACHLCRPHAKLNHHASFRTMQATWC